MKSLVLLATIINVMLFLTACERDDTPVSSLSITSSTPNAFAKPLNRFPSLAPGTYTVVVATALVGETDSYTLDVSFDDGTVTNHIGSWTNSGGQSHTSTDNKTETFTLDVPGGITLSLTSTVDNYLYLLDKNGNILYEDDNSGSANNAQINLPKSKIDNTAWATAYYNAIDPTNAKDTLYKWRLENNFIDINGVQQADVKQLIFRDTKDLGYGRRIYYRPGMNGCLFVYVENFLVDLREGLPYSTLNLLAAADNNRTHHFGTNAIEFSPLDGDCNAPVTEPLFTKFYTFKSNLNNPALDEPRLLSANLDGRWDISVPVSCVLCHNGKAKPLLGDGTFASASLPGSSLAEIASRVADTNSQLRLLQLDSFEYATASGLSRAEQEADFKELNQLIYNTYPALPNTGEPSTTFSREMADGWYNDNISNVGNTTYDGLFVPTGWRYDPSDNYPPASAEELFLKVVKPYCLSCHVVTGTTQNQDFDFSSYDKLISYADVIEDYVYDRGNMPLSVLNYERFWASDAPEILATHLPNFSHSNSDGSISQPGKPVAKPGLDRNTNSPALLDASPSLFSEGYQWTITSSPVGSSASIVDETSSRTTFIADTNGEYVLSLMTSNGSQSSDSASVTIIIDSTMTPLAENITFDADIKPVLQADCTGCHATQPGISVYFTDSTTLYQDVLNLINFNAPELSYLLLKPAGYHHDGGMRSRFDLDNDKTDYNLFLNWILNGAVEK